MRPVGNKWHVWTSLVWARPLPAVLWPCLLSTFISSLIPKASLSLSLSLLHHQCPLICCTRSISFPLFPLLSRLTCLTQREGVLTVSLTMVLVFVPPSSSCSLLTQCVLLAFTELAPFADDEGMKEIKGRGMERHEAEGRRGALWVTFWKRCGKRLYGWRLKLMNQLKQLRHSFFFCISTWKTKGKHVVSMGGPVMCSFHPLIICWRLRSTFKGCSSTHPNSIYPPWRRIWSYAVKMPPNLNSLL